MTRARPPKLESPPPPFAAGDVAINLYLLNNGIVVAPVPRCDVIVVRARRRSKRDLTIGVRQICVFGGEGLLTTLLGPIFLKHAGTAIMNYSCVND